MFKNGMRPVHPGEILMDGYIKPMGVSVRAVALALHVPYSRLGEIIKGERGIRLELPETQTVGPFIDQDIAQPFASRKRLCGHPWDRRRGSSNLWRYCLAVLCLAH